MPDDTRKQFINIGAAVLILLTAVIGMPMWYNDRASTREENMKEHLQESMEAMDMTVNRVSHEFEDALKEVSNTVNLLAKTVSVIAERQEHSLPYVAKFEADSRILHTHLAEKAQIMNNINLQFNTVDKEIANLQRGIELHKENSDRRLESYETAMMQYAKIMVTKSGMQEAHRKMYIDLYDKEDKLQNDINDIKDSLRRSWKVINENLKIKNEEYE